MAKEYIEREAIAMGVLGLTIVDPMVAQYADAVLHQIQQVPAADVVEVRHGRWVQVICHEEFEDGFVDRVKECCSVCHAPNWRRTSNYCPNCGARMDGDT